VWDNARDHLREDGTFVYRKDEYRLVCFECLRVEDEAWRTAG